MWAVGGMRTRLMGQECRGGGRVEVRVRDFFYQNIGSRVDRTALELNFGGQIALPSLLDNFQTHTNGFRK